MRPGSVSEDVITDAITELRELSVEIADTVQNNQDLINNNQAATKQDIANVTSDLEEKAYKAFVTPEDFGALKDGSGDSTYINQAIDYSVANNIECRLVGKYYIDSPCFIKRGLNLRGSGTGTILYLMDGKDCSILKPYADDSLNEITLSNFILDGNYDNQTDATITLFDLNATVSTYADKLSTIENVTVKYARGTGILVGSQTREVKFNNVTVYKTYNYDSYGMKILGTDNYFINCVCVGTKEGFYIEGSNNKFTNCKSFYSKNNGVNISSGSYNQFSSTEVQENGESGISLGNYAIGNTFSSTIIDTNGRLDNESPEILLLNNARYNKIDGIVSKRTQAGYSKYIFGSDSLTNSNILGNIFNLNSIVSDSTKQLVPFKNDIDIGLSNTIKISDIDINDALYDINVSYNSAGVIDGWTKVKDSGMEATCSIDKRNKIQIFNLTDATINTKIVIYKDYSINEGDKVRVASYGNSCKNYGLLLQLDIYDSNNTKLITQIKTADHNKVLNGDMSFDWRNILFTEAPTNASYARVTLSTYAKVDNAGEGKTMIKKIKVDII